MYLDPKFNPKDVQKRMATVFPTDPVKLSVKCSARDDWIRFVTCWEITSEDTQIATEKIVFVLRELEREYGTVAGNRKRLESAFLHTQAAIEVQSKKSKL